MKFNLQSTLKYLISLSVAVALFYWVYSKIELDEMANLLQNVNYFWIGASSFIALISHLNRGWRWTLALQPLGYKVPVFNAFNAVMVGYLANTLVPRMGEVARCTILKKTNQVSIKQSFGAVVTERALDMVILLSLTAFTVIVEFDKIGGFLTENFIKGADAIQLKVMILGVGGVLFLVFVGLVYKNHQRLMEFPIYEKVFGVILGVKEGLLSIRRLTPQQKFWYLFHTLSIWMMYYFMTYVLFFTNEVTENMGMMVALSVFIMGGIAIVIPTPGGIGSYHFFVGITLVTYGLNQTEGAAFAFLMHTAQTLTNITFGSIALIISLIISSNKSGNVELATEAV